MQEKLPPHNIDVEASLLSAIIIDNDAWFEIADQQLDPEDFYSTKHQKIFAAMNHLFTKNEPIDTVMLNNVLIEKGDSADCGGPEYLSSLLDEIPMAVDAPHYAKIIKDLATKRNLIKAHSKAIRKALKPGTTADQAISTSLMAVSSVADNVIRSSSLGIVGDAIPEALERYQNAQEVKTGVTGLATGYYELDRLTMGLQSSNLIILAARPSMGKTAFALNIAKNVCEDDKTVLFFSVEMAKPQLMDRIIGSKSGVKINSARKGFLKKTDWQILNDACGDIDTWKLYIDDSSTISYQQIGLIAKKLNRTNPISLIIIDYLQIVDVGYGGNKNHLIGAATRSFKALAKDLNIPVIVLSQLSRKLEERNNKRPKLSDLRDSGEIEQDADIAMFIYRDAVYNKDENDPHRGRAEIIVGKHRDGPTGAVELDWQPDIQRFSDL
jgi:replicative DNA helicase